MLRYRKEGALVQTTVVLSSQTRTLGEAEDITGLYAGLALQ